MIHELRLPRESSALWMLHKAIPAGGVCLLVRFTGREMIAVYRLTK